MITQQKTSRTRYQYPRNLTQKPTQHKKEDNADVLKIIPLGGLEEIGRNMTLFELLKETKSN